MTDLADEGFVDYEVKTIDPGPTMIVFTIFVSILLYAMLPFLVACGERRHRKRRAWELHERLEQDCCEYSDGYNTDTSKRSRRGGKNRSRTNTKGTTESDEHFLEGVVSVKCE